jgi:type II secretory pathway component PulM
MSELWGRVTAAFANLGPRERLLVSTAAGLTGFAILYFAVVIPVIGIGDRASERLEGAQNTYQMMRRLRANYDEVSGRLAGVEKRIVRGRRGNLRTTLENLAARSQVRVESMEPQTAPASAEYRETKVEVGLRSVTLPQTIAYLHQIESSNDVLAIKTLRIRTRPDKPELLDVTFTVSAFERI